MLLILLIFKLFQFDAYASDLDTFKNSDTAYSSAEVDKLKDKVVNTKLQLQIFDEIIKKEGIEQSYPEISVSFKNNLSKRYKVYSVEYIVDGVRTYYYQSKNNKVNKKEEVEKNNVQSYSANLSPGKHTIEVVVNFTGNDKGVFSYLSEYKIQIKDSKDINLKKNTNYNIVVSSYEEGGLLADFKEKAKLDIAFQEVSK